MPSLVPQQVGVLAQVLAQEWGWLLADVLLVVGLLAGGLSVGGLLVGGLLAGGLLVAGSLVGGLLVLGLLVLELLVGGLLVGVSLCSTLASTSGHANGLHGVGLWQDSFARLRTSKSPNPMSIESAQCCRLLHLLCNVGLQLPSF